MNAEVDARDGADDANCGVLVVGHGTRDAAGIAEFHQVVRKLAMRLAPRPVAGGFLELAEPTIADGVERLVDLGHNRLIVAPVILFAAGHAKDDIPAAVAAAPAGGRDGLFWIQTDPLGLHPQLVELSRLRYDEAIAAAPPTDEPIEPAETLLILVGRGSSDAEAVADMEAFARRRTDETPVGRVMAAFVAVAEPRLDDVLRQAAAWPFRRVVIQPHLLFHGELLDGLRRRVAAAAESAPDRQWIVTAHLGPHELLIDALCERIAAANG